MAREIIGACLMLMGAIVIVTAVAGTYRFKYVLNRMHAAALCDTLGLLLVLSGLIVISGFTALSAKLFAIIVFMWLASPVMSHLIARAEVMTYSHIEDECEVVSHDDSL